MEKCFLPSEGKRSIEFILLISKTWIKIVFKHYFIPMCVIHTVYLSGFRYSRITQERNIVESSSSVKTLTYPKRSRDFGLRFKNTNI